MLEFNNRNIIDNQVTPPFVEPDSCSNSIIFYNKAQNKVHPSSCGGAKNDIFQNGNIHIPIFFLLKKIVLITCFLQCPTFPGVRTRVEYLGGSNPVDLTAIKS